MRLGRRSVLVTQLWECPPISKVEMFPSWLISATNKLTVNMHNSWTFRTSSVEVQVSSRVPWLPGFGAGWSPVQQGATVLLSAGEIEHQVSVLEISQWLQCSVGRMSLEAGRPV